MKNKIIIITISLLSFASVAKDTTDDNRLALLQEFISESKLLPTPAGVGGDGARFGESVSIDGTRALIGSPSALEHGVAYIFDYDGTTWNETQLFFPNGLDAGNSFGTAVSLEGDRAVITDKFDSVFGTNQSGAVYVYDLNNGEWEFTQKLIATDASSSDFFGSSVSLSNNRVLIGATGYDVINDEGAAYVFDYNGASWLESAILIATNGSSGDNFGNSVGLDGDLALVGASNFYDNNNAIETGSGYLFEFVTDTWSQTKQFLASDGADADKYGTDVSLSNNKVLIGANETDENFNASGSAYVYAHDGSMWVETKLLAPDAALADRFGTSVSIENNRIVVGARDGEITGSATGSAYIYDFNSTLTIWEFTQEISADDITTNNFFASSLGLSGDKVIVGNFNDSNNGSQSGAVYVFDLNGTWQQSQKIVTQGAVEDNFGYAISLDGNRALIGAPLDDDNGSDAGAAYIFDFVNGQWSSPVKLLSSVTDINFGMSVDLSGDRAIIGSNRIAFESTGSAYIFDFNGTTWTETVILDSASLNDEFGYSVSLSGDRALVGAYFDSENGVKSGTVYVYELNGTWQLTDKLIPSDGQLDDIFGFSVNLFADRAIVGAYTKDDTISGFSRAGAAYIYDYDAVNDLWIETKLEIPNPSTNGFFGRSVDLENNRAVVGASNGRGLNNSTTGTAYIYDYDSSSDMWSGVTLFASDGSSSDNFGISVSLDNDRALIGAHLDDDNDTNSGAAYQFDYDGNTWMETKKYLASDGANSDLYGWSVSLSDDNALIAAYQDNDSGTDSGSVYTFNVEFVFGDGFED